MMTSWFKTVSAALLSLAMFSGAATAQVAGGEEEALRAEQAELFTRMFEQPDNVELMFEYALLSIRLQDYEAAITTLERILIYDPNQPRVRMELGAAYYRIGSYPVARQYFAEVMTDPMASSDLKARVGRFVAEIDRRTQTSYFTGTVGARGIFTTNANNGPANRSIELFGIPAQLTDPDVTAQEDVGAAAYAQISHFYDLGMPNEDHWRTDLTLYSVRYADTSDAAVDVFAIRTGPRLSVEEDRYGVKLRPFIEADHVRYGNDPLHTTIGGGVELTNTLDQQTAIFADLRLGWRDSHVETATSDQDGLRLRSRAGVNYFHDEALSLTGFAIAEYDDAETKADRNVELGLGGIATWRYDSGVDFASRRWRLDLGARASIREFEGSSPLITSGGDRSDLDIRLSLDHTAYIQDGFALVGRAEYFLRDSNADSGAFDVDAFTVSIGAQFSF